MNKLLLATAITLSLGLTVPAQAKHSHSYYTSIHYSSGHHYGGHHYRHHRHYRGHRRHDHRAEYLLGGLALGAIIGSAHHHRHNNHCRHNSHSRHGYSSYSYAPPTRVYHSPVVVSRTPATVYQQPVIQPPVAQSEGAPRDNRSTYRLMNGNECYLVNTNQDGHDILTQVPAMNCE